MRSGEGEQGAPHAVGGGGAAGVAVRDLGAGGAEGELAGQKMSSISHGTAVASMLVGSKKYGSLLPGAHLSAANVFHRTKKGRSRASAKSILKAYA